MPSVKRTYSQTGYKQSSGYKKQKLKQPSYKKFYGKTVLNEQKYFDTAINTATGTTGTVTELLLVPSAVGKQSRVGDTIFLKSVLLRGFVQGINFTTTGSEALVRIVVCSFTTGTTTGATILESASLTSPINVGNSDKIHVYIDEVVNVGSKIANNATTDLIPTCCNKAAIKRFVKFRKEIKVKYPSDSTVSPSTNNLVVLCISDINGPTTSLVGRVRYTDA